jgi:multidrug efflux pump subunit AcrA (membrane-fusion protein)
LQHADASVRSGSTGQALRPILIWLAVAVVLILAGCGGAPAAAGAPAGDTPAPVEARAAYPTAYPESVPASDEVVLKWNGTLVLPGEARPIVRTSQ